MTAALVRSLVTCLFSKSCFSLYKSHVSFSLYFSTDRGEQPLGTPTVSEFLTHNHHFSPESASRVASVLTGLKNLENADSILSFLKETGFSNTQLETPVVSLPSVLSANLETTINPRIRILQDFGFTTNEIAEIVSKNPFLLKLGTNKLISSLSVLKGLLGSNMEVIKFFRTSGLFLHDLDKPLVPNVEFLKRCGVSVEQINRRMKIPGFLLLNKQETVRKFVEKANEMGCNRSSRRFIYAVQAVSSMTNETWELKLKTLRELVFRK